MRVEYHGDDWLERFEREQKQRITKAAILLSNEVKKEVSVPVEVVRAAPGRGAGGKFTKGKIESVERSAPGEPPRKEDGELRRSIAWEVDDSGDEIIGRVGTNKIYGLYLETGTTDMAPRPFLRSTLNKIRDRLVAIINGT